MALQLNPRNCRRTVPPPDGSYPRDLEVRCRPPGSSDLALCRSRLRQYSRALAHYRDNRNCEASLMPPPQSVCDLEESDLRATADHPADAGAAEPES